MHAEAVIAMQSRPRKVEPGKSATGQAFTSRPLNERRLSSAEADQALTSQVCQDRTFLRALLARNFFQQVVMNRQSNRL
jgi:hypothetical protein